jgi:hypothetical protein
MSINKPIRVHNPSMKKDARMAYDPRKKSTNAELICKVCKAIYQDKYWQPFAKLNPKNVDKLKQSVCPACHSKRAMASDGVLHLSGTFLKNHNKEIMGIILNTEAKENKRDVLNRIERIEYRGAEIIVYTGKNQLAVEMGKKVSSAYKGGELSIKWSKDDKPADVKWHKDEINKLT